MIKSDAKLKKLTSAFRNNNKKFIKEAIELLRNEQPFEGAIGLLSSLYDRSSEGEIKRSIESFMNDVKDQAATGEVITEIKRGWKPDTTRMLVSSCWQSGLDYSSYSLDLAEVFVGGDFATSFECMTVIEEFAGELKPAVKAKIIKQIQNSKNTGSPEKIALSLELISLLGK